MFASQTTSANCERGAQLGFCLLKYRDRLVGVTIVGVAGLCGREVVFITNADEAWES